jgi:membrane associated rhomboid family serine protease
MLFVPYTTDAPVYYFPYGTIGLIIANVLMFVVFCTGGQLHDSINVHQNEGAQAALAQDDAGLQFADDEENQPDFSKLSEEEILEQLGLAVSIDKSDSFSRNLVLDYGEGLKPWQWLTSFFMHADWLHLIGNMIFLWSFGLVVEGKIGPLFFVPLYFLIGAGECCVEQTLMLFANEGTSLGASSAIFGLMALVMVWAPVNEFGVVLLVGRIFTFEIPHFVFGVIYVGLNILSIYIEGFFGSGGLHMLGFAVALPLGLFLLKQGYVDCEGYDALSYWHGKYGKESTVGKKEAKERRKKQIAKEKAIEDRQPKQPISLEPLQQQVSEAIAAGDLEVAIKLQTRLSQKYPQLTWRQSDLKRLISEFIKLKKYEQAFPLMETYITLFPSDAFTAQSVMAKIWLQQERPKHTLRFLKTLNLELLTPEQRPVFKKLVDTAKSQIESGVVEY